MQISLTQELDGGRQHFSIGRIKAAGAWRAASAPLSEADRACALRALMREADDCGAEAVVGVTYEIDSVRGADIDGVALQRIVARGMAVRFAVAA